MCWGGGCNCTYFRNYTNPCFSDSIGESLVYICFQVVHMILTGITILIRYILPVETWVRLLIHNLYRGKNFFNACLSVAGSIYEDCCNRFRSGAIWSFYNRLHWRTKSYKFWQFSGRGLKPDPKPKFFMQLWYQGLKISLPNENECSTLKNKNVKILTILGRGLKWDPQTKIFQHIWYQSPEIYIPFKFEYAMLKNKNFKILTIFGAGSKMGPPNQIFSTYMVSGLWNLHTV